MGLLGEAIRDEVDTNSVSQLTFCVRSLTLVTTLSGKWSLKDSEATKCLVVAGYYGNYSLISYTETSSIQGAPFTSVSMEYQFKLFYSKEFTG